jgi:hypothetical protein
VHGECERPQVAPGIATWQQFQSALRGRGLAKRRVAEAWHEYKLLGRQGQPVQTLFNSQSGFFFLNFFFLHLICSCINSNLNSYTSLSLSVGLSSSLPLNLFNYVKSFTWAQSELYFFLSGAGSRGGERRGRRGRGELGAGFFAHCRLKKAISVMSVRRVECLFGLLGVKKTIVAILALYMSFNLF